MINHSIYISIKMLGKRQPIITKQAFLLTDVFLEQPTLQNFLQLVVTKEVANYNEKTTNKSLLPYLDKTTLAKMAEYGKVDFGEMYNTEPAILEEAVSTAIQAFEDGLFMILIDGAICRNLAQKIQFRENSEVVFLRLVALAGGYF